MSQPEPERGERCPRCGAALAAGGVPCGCGRSAEVPTLAEPIGAAPTARSRPSPQAAPPRTLGPYQILGELGRGGMGVVYKAYQPALKRTVALKVMTAGPFAAAATRRRFLREAESAAKLRHPHIVPILDLGSEGELLYFTMAYVPGRTLSQAIAAGELSRDERIALLEKVAGAVAYAHRCGVIHRDLKPANILIGEGGDPQVTDFGLAAQPGADSSLSDSRQALGTPNYMAPEQAGYHRLRVDERSDVYGLGATLYEALTGRRPFGNGPGTAVLLRVMEGELVPPRQLDRTIPRDLEVICLQAMAREPRRRYASAAELGRDLGRYRAGEPIAARPGSWSYRIGKRLARHRVAAALGGLLLAALAVLGSGAMLQWTRARATWRQAFADDFQRAALGPALRPVSGRWWVDGGALRGEGSGDAFLELARDFPGSLRVELEAEVLPGSGKHEIGVLLVSRTDGAVGYYLGFGGDYGMTAIDRRDVEVRLTPAPVVEAGRPYRIAVTRRGNLVAMVVDGEEVARYVDPMPLNPAEYSRLRLSTFDGGVRVTGLRVLQQRLPELLTATAVGDRLFERGEVAAALDEYARIARDHPGRPMAVEARYKQGLCLLHLGRYAEATTALRQAAATREEPFFTELARIGLGMALRLRGRHDEAWRYLVRLEASTADPEARYRLAEELERLGTAYFRARDQPANARVRRFVIERFGDLPAAESSALLLATISDDDREIERRLLDFLARFPRVGKPRAFALQSAGVLALARDDRAAAVAAFSRLEREYAATNRHFSLEGIYGRGLAAACAGDWDGALAAAERLAGFRAVPPAAAHAAELRALVHQLRGEPRLALQALPEGHGEDPMVELERALLLRDAGEGAAAAALLEQLTADAESPAAPLAALMLGAAAPAAVEADPGIPSLAGRRWLWEEARRRGDVAAAERHARALTDYVAGLHPGLCRAVRWRRELADSR